LFGGGWGICVIDVSVQGKNRAKVMPISRTTHLQFCASRHHLLESNTNALNNSKQYGAADGTVPRRLKASSYRKRSAGQEARPYRIPRILLVSQALDRAVEGAEETAPDAEVASEDRRSHFDRCEGAYPSLAVGTVAEAFYAVPYCAAYRLLEVG
jgi:hypothetical protein